MAQMKTLYKAYKIKGLLDELAVLKKNAIRGIHGLPPILPWYEECYTNAMTWMRETLLQAFCPCCIYDRRRHKQRAAKKWYSRLSINGTYENDVVKSMLGFIGGVVISFFLYCLMNYQIEFSARTSAIASAIFGALLCLGLAFTHSVRCMTLLVLPQFFSSKGRAFLMIYAFALVMGHPVKNFSHNMIVMSESATCGQSMAYNQTKDMINAAISPMMGVLGSIRSVLMALQVFAEAMRNVFMSLKRAVEEISAAIKGAMGWLKSIVTSCNDKMGSPYRKCKNAFDTAVKDCRNSLGVFDFVCEIPKAVGHICHILRVGELLCLLTSYLTDLMASEIGRPVVRAVQSVYDMFYVNITMHYHYNMTSEQSRSYDEVKGDIMAEIKETINSFNFLLDILNYLLTLAVLFVFIKAILYRQKYLCMDDFDNGYITVKLEDIDQRRQDLGKETILPLSWREDGKYIKTLSLTMASNEFTKTVRGIAVLVSSGFYVGFYIMVDYGLFWMLDLIRRHFEVKVHNAIPAGLKMHVQGDGIIADMYRALLGLFDPLTGADVNLDTTICLPNPSPPNYSVYRNIAFIYGLCLFLTLFEAYALRIRHVVMGCYHPQRAKERAVWLYNHILKKRGGFLKFCRRQLRRKYFKDEAVAKSSMRAKFIAMFPCLGKLVKLMGYETKMCLCCSQEGKTSDIINFIECSSPGCTALYCMDCFTDINNLCTVCMNPVDYGDMSDMSEERDSSEDEEELARRKQVAVDRKARMEERRANRRGSKILNSFKGMIEGNHPMGQMGLTPGLAEAGIPLLQKDLKEADDTELSDSSDSMSVSGSTTSCDSGEALDYSYQTRSKEEMNSSSENIEKGGIGEAEKRVSTMHPSLTELGATPHRKSSELVSMDIFEDYGASSTDSSDFSSELESDSYSDDDRVKDELKPLKIERT